MDADGTALLMAHVSGINRYWLADGRTEQLVPASAEGDFLKAYPRLSEDGQTLFYAEGSISGAGAKLMRHDLTSGKAVPSPP